MRNYITTKANGRPLLGSDFTTVLRRRANCSDVTRHRNRLRRLENINLYLIGAQISVSIENERGDVLQTVTYQNSTT